MNAVRPEHDDLLRVIHSHCAAAKQSLQQLVVALEYLAERASW